MSDNMNLFIYFFAVKKKNSLNFGKDNFVSRNRKKIVRFDKKMITYILYALVREALRACRKPG
jgi:hypothetical protein